MNHYILITIISIISLASIFTNSITLVSSSEKVNTTEPVTQTEELSYTIREYHGKIALFTGDNPKPDAVYDIFTSSLPDIDAQALKEGITVGTKQEAQKIIEDYTS